jgi:hypothetical protein
MIFFEHKSFLFLFFGVLINGYILNILLSLFFEWPFRTMSRVVFSAPQRVLMRLKNDLAKELNTAQVEEDVIYEEQKENAAQNGGDIMDEIQLDAREEHNNEENNGAPLDTVSMLISSGNKRPSGPGAGHVTGYFPSFN